MHLKGSKIILAAWLESHFIYVMAVKNKTPAQNHPPDQITEKQISCCAVWYTQKTVMVIIQIRKMSMTIVLQSSTAKEQLWIVASTHSDLFLNTTITLICVFTCFRYIYISKHIKDETLQNVSVWNTNLTQYSIPNLLDILWNVFCLMKNCTQLSYFMISWQPFSQSFVLYITPIIRFFIANHRMFEMKSHRSVLRLGIPLHWCMRWSALSPSLLDCDWTIFAISLWINRSQSPQILSLDTHSFVTSIALLHRSFVVYNYIDWCDATKYQTYEWVRPFHMKIFHSIKPCV